MLSPSEQARYHRQWIIPEFGKEAQKRLKSSHVIIVGLGGLGCCSALYLTAAGVGQISMVDFDVVQRSDLNRQILYSEEDIGKKKVFIAHQKLSKLNPYIRIIPIPHRITQKNIMRIIDQAQVVIDGLDNLNTRLLVNSACVSYQIPFIYGGVSRLRGMLTTIIPGKTPCLACLFTKGGQKNRRLGVLGVIPGVIANLQSLEAIKCLIGESPSLAGKLLRFNGNDMKFQINDLKRNERCKVCSLKFSLSPNKAFKA